MIRVKEDEKKKTGLWLCRNIQFGCGNDKKLKTMFAVQTCREGGERAYFRVSSLRPPSSPPLLGPPAGYIPCVGRRKKEKKVSQRFCSSDEDETVPIVSNSKHARLRHDVPQVGPVETVRELQEHIAAHQ
jgi:hypothetical protein